MGPIYLAATASKGGSGATTLLLFAVMAGVFYLLILRPNRNRQRKVAQTQNQIMPGQRIRTTAGMYGTVISGDDRDVVIEIAPDVHVTMLRRAIMEVLPDDFDAEVPEEEPAGDDEYEHGEAGTEHDEPRAEQPLASPVADSVVTDPEVPDDLDHKDHSTEQGKK